MPAFDRKDFEARYADLLLRARRLWRITLTLLVVVWVALLSAVWLFSFVRWPAWARGVAFGLFGLVFVGWAVAHSLVWWAPVARQVGLVCPFCRKSLAAVRGRPTGLRVLATGKCPSCGAAVVEPGAPSAVVPASRPRPSPFATLGLVLLVAASVVTGRRLNTDYCQLQYAGALTAADTAHADSVALPVNGRSRTPGGTCVNYRHARLLEGRR